MWGILSCSESGELNLAIVGSLTNGWAAAITTVNPSLTILGETYGERGQAVTLRGCFETNTTVSNNRLRNRQAFFGQRGYFGAHLSSATDPTFHTAILSYSGLASWAQGFTGFLKGEPFYAAKWAKPANRGATIPGCRFELDVRISHTRSAREQTLSEDVLLRCEFEPPVVEPEFQSRIAYGIQGLLTFATGRPNALTQVRVDGTSDSEGVRIVGPAVYADEAEASDLDRGDMLFTLDDIGDRFEDVFRRWFALSERYSQVLPLYFGGLYRPPGYTDLRFAQVLQTLTLYQADRDANLRGSSPADEFLSDFQSEISAEKSVRLRDLIDSHPLAGVQHALTRLVGENVAEFAPVVGGPERCAEFVQNVSNTQQYLLTRRLPPDGRALEGEDLYWLTERLDWLVKIILLKEIGFTLKEVHGLIFRNARYNAAKLQAIRKPDLRT